MRNAINGVPLAHSTIRLGKECVGNTDGVSCYDEAGAAYLGSATLTFTFFLFEIMHAKTDNFLPFSFFLSELLVSILLSQFFVFLCFCLVSSCW